MRQSDYIFYATGWSLSHFVFLPSAEHLNGFSVEQFSDIGVLAIFCHVKKGEDIRKFIDEDGWGVLHWAAQCNHIGLTRTICISNGGVPSIAQNKANHAGDTAFGIALRNHHWECASAIVSSAGFVLDRNKIHDKGANGECPWDVGACHSASKKWYPIWKLKECRTMDECVLLVGEGHSFLEGEG